MWTSTRRWIAPALAATLVLSACRDDGSPTTSEPTLTEPAGTEPPVTEPSGTQPVPTDPPATEPTVTDPPSTEPTVTEPPATQPPVTEPPATEPPATDPPVTQPPATDPPLTTEPPVNDVLVNVYWAWTVLGDQVLSPERIAAGARAVPGDTPTRHALEALVVGLDDIEREIGMINTVPAGTRVLGISVDGTTATVDLSGEFEAPAGSLEEMVRLAQVVFTVTQFDEFDRVKFHIDGVPREFVMQHGLDVADGVTRDDFTSIRALIMIEEPYPGQAVGNPLVVRGESSTFEGTVDYALTTGGGDGLIVTEGFTMGGSFGAWRPFELVIDLRELPDTYRSGPGSIIMWETSPEDGSQQHIVEIPIVLPEL